MGRMGGIKWEKASSCRPVHNIISSDFPKYNPQPWKFMEGKSRIEWLLSYEYHRMWLEEREAWKKRMYPENTTVSVDIVKSYVLTFKTNHQAPKPEKKKPFKMKKFEGVGSKTENKRPAGDKAMGFEKEKKKQKPPEKTK
ncbi:uncharacterized protein LOC135087882 [Ostrinia nubilalis]|uniref:uncharacterized protein LOC114364119 n=1 Tax=Ostrinia furnacalis TaxID=93504 RepID=UPI00103DE6AE|nr:uncharacterized protein LOC114364119 [Ostrinia furnacalis]XP_028175921.1 uncharacterized protein LOC114364119 [Ostrinia furnacalis]